MMSSRINYITPPNLNNERISCWFTLRNQHSIHSERSIPGLNLGLNTDEKEPVILENRNLLLKELGLAENEIAYAFQIHGTEVKEVNEGGSYSDTDSFVTSKPGLALAIQVADCAAVLMGDTKNKVIGAAHAGWRGALGGIVSKTIHEMKALGADADHIQVYVSPCISLNNFEVGEEVAVKFPDKFVDRISFSKPHVDLKSSIRKELISQGIPRNNIQIDDSCTIEDEDFYSYRRQKDKSGRMMGIIKLNN